MYSMKNNTKATGNGILPPVVYLIALFDNNQANVIRALNDKGWRLYPPTLSLWKSGHSLIPPIWCKRLEQITDGAVTREMLRPDIFA